MYDKPCVAALAAALCVGAHGTVLDLSGAYTSDYDYTATAGTRSRAIDLKRSCTATFGDCDVSAKFEGPGGRFVSGGALVFNGGARRVVRSRHPRDGEGVPVHARGRDALHRLARREPGERLRADLPRVRGPHPLLPLPQPDHGRMLDIDKDRTCYYGYSYGGRLIGLSELRGLEAGIKYGLSVAGCAKT